MHETIWELACNMANPTEAEQPVLKALCSAAEAELSNMLRSGISPADCGDAFLQAAALTAVAGLIPGREVSGVEQFTAGDVSIRLGGSSQQKSADILRQQAKEMLRPFCADDSFAFLGVQG